MVWIGPGKESEQGRGFGSGPGAYGFEWERAFQIPTLSHGVCINLHTWAKRGPTLALPAPGLIKHAFAWPCQYPDQYLALALYKALVRAIGKARTGIRGLTGAGLGLEAEPGFGLRRGRELVRVFGPCRPCDAANGRLRRWAGHSRSWSGTQKAPGC